MMIKDNDTVRAHFVTSGLLETYGEVSSSLTEGTSFIIIPNRHCSTVLENDSTCEL